MTTRAGEARVRLVINKNDLYFAVIKHDKNIIFLYWDNGNFLKKRNTRT